MRTPANIAGHPIHPMLVTIPIGLWVFSLICDLIALRSGAPDTWNTVAFYTMVGGVVGALCAAVPGLVDLLSLGDSPVKKTAITHMSLNLAIVAIFAVNAWTRYHASVSHTVSLALSVLAIAMLLVSGWLGGKMVYQAGVGVDTEQDMMTARAGGWRGESERSWNRQQTTGGAMSGRERAMASDSTGPLRDGEKTREERASAGRTGMGDAPRE